MPSPLLRPLSLSLLWTLVACSRPPAPSGQSPLPAASAPAPTAEPRPAASAAASASSSTGFACAPAAPITRGKPPAPPQDSSKEVKTACEKLERASARVVSRRKAPQPEDEHVRKGTLANLGTCIRGPKGAWIFEVTRAGDGKGKGESYRPLSDNEATFAFDWELVHITPEGKELRGGPRGTALHFGSLSETIHVDGVHDLDGDGVAELVFTREHHNTDEEHASERAVWRTKGGKIELYPGTSGMKIRRLSDEDGDGRVDLVLQSGHHAEGPCGLDGQQFHGPELLAHTRPDGTFSRDDAVARAFVRDQCKEDPMHPLVIVEGQGKAARLDGDTSVHRVACATYWGLSGELLQRRIRSEYPRDEEQKNDDGEGSCVPRKLLLEVASQTPAFLLDGCPGQ